MNDERFDSWTRRLARGLSRGDVLRLLASSALGLVVVRKVRRVKADDLPAILHPLLDNDEGYIPDPSPEPRNPERGMYFGSRPNTPEEFHTIVPKWLYLAGVCGDDLVWDRDNPLQSSQVLRDYAADVLEPARMGGYKILFRPRYDKEDNSNGPKPSPSDCKINGFNVFHANTPDRQKNHIDEVAKMLADYKDVVAFIQAGYLGRWGEWNTADYEPENAPFLDSYTTRSEIIDYVLSRYAEEGIEQHVELRRPVFAKQVIDRQKSLDPNASPRVGFHNDCFMTDDSDYSTYGNYRSGEEWNFTGSNDAEIWADANRWSQESLTPNASFGGETCPIDDNRDDYSDLNERWRVCDNMTGANSEPMKLHMSYLNGDYLGDKCRPSDIPTDLCLANNGELVPGAVTTWRNGGCYDEIRRKLGYRFEVKRVSHTPTVPAGEKFQVEVEVLNTGLSKLHKPREARLVLRGGSPRSHAYTDQSGAGAVANWAPGQTITLSFSDVVDAGTYSVRLWIPDPDDPGNLGQEPDKRGNIDYSVKLATLRDDGAGQLRNVFDPDTGDNDLGVTIIAQ